MSGAVSFIPVTVIKLCLERIHTFSRTLHKGPVFTWSDYIIVYNSSGRPEKLVSVRPYEQFGNRKTRLLSLSIYTQTTIAIQYSS